MAKSHWLLSVAKLRLEARHHRLQSCAAWASRAVASSNLFHDLRSALRKAERNSEKHSAN